MDSVNIKLSSQVNRWTVYRVDSLYTGQFIYYTAHVISSLSNEQFIERKFPISIINSLSTDSLFSRHVIKYTVHLVKSASSG